MPSPEQKIESDWLERSYEESIAAPEEKFLDKINRHVKEMFDD